MRSRLHRKRFSPFETSFEFSKLQYFTIQNVSVRYYVILLLLGLSSLLKTHNFLKGQKHHERTKERRERLPQSYQNQFSAKEKGLSRGSEVSSGRSSGEKASI